MVTADRKPQRSLGRQTVRGCQDQFQVRQVEVFSATDRARTYVRQNSLQLVLSPQTCAVRKAVDYTKLYVEAIAPMSGHPNVQVTCRTELDCAF